MLRHNSIHDGIFRKSNLPQEMIVFSIWILDEFFTLFGHFKNMQ